MVGHKRQVTKYCHLLVAVGCKRVHYVMTTHLRVSVQIVTSGTDAYPPSLRFVFPDGVGLCKIQSWPQRLWHMFNSVAKIGMPASVCLASCMPAMDV